MSYETCRPFIVEDDSNYRILVARSFQKAGVPKPNVREVADGGEALRILAAESRADAPHSHGALSLFVLDLNLPGRSGLDVLGWIRGSSTFLEAPVFLLTSSENPDHRSRALELQADSYFVKPVAYQDLKTIVEGMLGHWQTLSLQLSAGRHAGRPPA